MKKTPIFVRTRSATEKQRLEKALHSTAACEMKRTQILLASSQGRTTHEINQQWGYSAAYARQMIHRSNEQGLACLPRKSCARLQQKKLLDAGKCRRIKQMMQNSLRQFGKASSLWTLSLMTEVLVNKT